MPHHLEPEQPLAPRVVLPGDPARALHIAQAVLDTPRMFNHRRGLWGYTGTAEDGELLTIQSSGMGGPSAAIVIGELIELGATTIVRAGTCGAFGDGLDLGALVAVAGALAEDGASRALGAEGIVVPDPALALDDVSDTARTAVSLDLFYDDREGENLERWRASDAAVVEMETATLFQLGRRHGIRTGSLLAVTDTLVPERRRVDAEAYEALGVRLGQAAVRALLAA